MEELTNLTNATKTELSNKIDNITFRLDLVDEKILKLDESIQNTGVRVGNLEAQAENTNILNVNKFNAIN